MMSLELSQEQKPTYDKLMQLVVGIEERLRMEIDSTNSDELSYEIQHRQQMAADSGLILEYATIIFNHMKGKAFEVATADKAVMEAKANFQKLYLDALLSKWHGMYSRCEEATKTLDKSISGLISILSYNKQLINSQVSI